MPKLENVTGLAFLVAFQNKYRLFFCVRKGCSAKFLLLVKLSTAFYGVRYISGMRILFNQVPNPYPIRDSETRPPNNGQRKNPSGKYPPSSLIMVCVILAKDMVSPPKENIRDSPK